MMVMMLIVLMLMVMMLILVLVVDGDDACDMLMVIVRLLWSCVAGEVDAAL